MGYKKYLDSTQIVPDTGGEYREGIIADSISDVQLTVKKLTKIGLVRFDENGEIKPNLAEKWEISEDKKSYTFYLINDIKSEELVEIIRQDKPSWSDIDIESPEEKIIKFNLKQPFAPLLANLSEPLLPYGPYKIDKETKSEITLVPRENYIYKEPYLQKIILKLYPDYNNLLKALKGKQLDGVSYIETEDDLSKNFNYYQMQLPRYLILFFNLNSPVWEKKSIRQHLAKSEPTGENLTATLVTSTKQINIEKAEEIKNKWQEFGVNLEIRYYEPSELQLEIIPNRQYDLLLYGLDYGYDPDPYPFWHSSQVTDKGLNLSNFSDVDADKLLEQARMTIDSEERNKKYESFWKIFDEEAPAIILQHEIWNYAISKKVKGTITDIKAFSPADRFFAINEWYIKEKRIKINF